MEGRLSMNEKNFQMEGHTKYLQGINVPIYVNSIQQSNGITIPSEVSEMHIGKLDNGTEVLFITPAILSISCEENYPIEIPDDMGCVTINVLSDNDMTYTVQIPITDSNKEYITNSETRSSYIENWVMGNLRSVKMFEEPVSYDALSKKIDLSEFTDITRLCLYIDKSNGVFKIFLSIIYGESADEGVQILAEKSLSDNNMEFLSCAGEELSDRYGIPFNNKCGVN